MIHLAEAVRRNNAASIHIDNQNYGEASFLISETLKEFRLARHSFPDDVSCLVSTDDSPIILPREEAFCVGQDECCGMNGGFVYRRPIYIQHDWEPTSATVVAFILIFNLALAHQLQVTTRKEDDGASSTIKQFLERSTALYELAYQLLLSKPDAFSIRVSLVLCNNLGQAHRALSNHHKANGCFSRLLSTLLYLKDCGMEIEIGNGDAQAPLP